MEAVELIEPSDYLSDSDQLLLYTTHPQAHQKHMGIRFMVDHLQTLCRHDIRKLFKSIDCLQKDQTISIRLSLAEQLFEIGSHFSSHSKLGRFITSDLYDVLYRSMNDSNSQVRRASYESVFKLLENNSIPHSLVDNTLLTVVLELTSNDNEDELRADGVYFLMGICSYMDSATLNNTVLPLFIKLANDASFHVRKASALSFGEMSRLIGSELSERHLLCVFLELCEDSVWSVRKAAVASFPAVSNGVSSKTRATLLADFYMKLLGDQSRWVRLEAYESLGEFIFTFHNDPFVSYDNHTGDNEKTDENHVEDVECIAEYPPTLDPTCNSVYSDTDINKNTPDTAIVHDVNTNNSAIPLSSRPLSLTLTRQEVCFNKNIDLSREEDEDNDALSTTTRAMIEETQSPSTEASPLCELQSFPSHTKCKPILKIVEASIEEIEDAPMCQVMHFGSSHHLVKTSSIRSIHNDNGDNDEDGENDVEEELLMGGKLEMVEDLSSPKTALSLPNEEGVAIRPLSPITCRALKGSRWGRQSMAFVATPKMNAGKKIDVAKHIKTSPVPLKLLEQFIAMSQPQFSEALDSMDNQPACAFNFPAVALTLTSCNWRPVLWEAYRTMAACSNVKVRRSLAFSMHEIIKLLNETDMKNDIVSIFDDFCCDVDEVKIGALSHLSQFLKYLPYDLKLKYITKMPRIITEDNGRNWRTRKALLIEVEKLVCLFTYKDIQLHIISLIFLLLNDQTAVVRKSAISLLSRIIRHLSNNKLVCHADDHLTPSHQQSHNTSDSVNNDLISSEGTSKPNENDGTETKTEAVENQHHTEQERLFKSIKNDVISLLAHSSKFRQRQSFITLCNFLLMDSEVDHDALFSSAIKGHQEAPLQPSQETSLQPPHEASLEPPQEASQETSHEALQETPQEVIPLPITQPSSTSTFLSSLLQLHTDAVVNVRIMLCQTLQNNFIRIASLKQIKDNPSELLDVLNRLWNDSDPEVHKLATAFVSMLVR